MLLMFFKQFFQLENEKKNQSIRNFSFKVNLKILSFIPVTNIN